MARWRTCVAGRSQRAPAHPVVDSRWVCAAWCRPPPSHPPHSPPYVAMRCVCLFVINKGGCNKTISVAIKLPGRFWRCSTVLCMSTMNRQQNHQMWATLICATLLCFVNVNADVNVSLVVESGSLEHKKSIRNLLVQRLQSALELGAHVDAAVGATWPVYDDPPHPARAPNESCRSGLLGVLYSTE